ncbi:Unknown protein, partial [Striga hermonthica]
SSDKILSLKRLTLPEAPLHLIRESNEDIRKAPDPAVPLREGATNRVPLNPADLSPSPRALPMHSEITSQDMIKLVNRRSPGRNSPKRNEQRRASPRRGGRDAKWERRDEWQRRPMVFERQRYHNFTPLRKDMAEVLEAMEQKMSTEDVTWPKTRFTGPLRPMSDLYCRFHKDYGHTTENCRHLKDEIERLIRAGYLKEFVYHDRVKGKGRRRCREDSEERSDRDEEGDGRDGRGKKPRRDGDKGGHGGETPMKKGTIYMISGGPTDGDSNRARKEHARAVKRKREEVGITARMLVISFKAEDAEGVVLPHNDALVITAEVAGFDVKRVFIDTGSSVDVMFYDCFVQINKELNMELKPVATTLYGFNGGEVMPMGEVSLPVALGSGELRKVRMVRFVVVGAESSYNIIMGRTSLNAFQAVVSTYHMTIKYPVDYEFLEAIISLGSTGLLDHYHGRAMDFSIMSLVERWIARSLVWSSDGLLGHYSGRAMDFSVISLVVSLNVRSSRLLARHPLDLTFSNGPEDRFSFMYIIYHIRFGSVRFLIFAKLNGVSPVVDLGVVRYAQSTELSSSTHAPEAFSNLVFSLFSIIRLVTSTWPLACGCAMEAKCCSIFIFSHHARIRFPLNCVPLSEINTLGTPNRQQMLSYMNLITFSS